MSCAGGRRRIILLLWILLLLNMAAIFALSAKTAEESTVMSDAVLVVPKEAYDSRHPETVGDERVYWWFQFLVRKTAHLLEFAALSIWATCLLFQYQIRFPFVLGVSFSAVYALSD